MTEAPPPPPYVMFIKFNEQNRCKQIIESNRATAVGFGGGLLEGGVAVAAAAAAAAANDSLTSSLSYFRRRRRPESGDHPVARRQFVVRLKPASKLMMPPPEDEEARRRRRRRRQASERVEARVSPLCRAANKPVSHLIRLLLLLSVLVCGSGSSSGGDGASSASNQANTRLFSRQLQQLAAGPRLPSSMQLVAAAGNQQQQQQHPDAPKLIPLSALDRYQEGADLKLFCSASAPPAAGRLHFEWRKNNGEQLFSSQEQPAVGVAAGSSKQQQQQQPLNSRHLHIGMMDDSSSMLRINQLEADDSGNYTCLARNQHGLDSSTVRVNVHVRLKWIREPPSELQVRAGKSVQVECDASGQPAPLISWTSLKDHQTIASKVLRFDRAQVNDSGLYECRATSGGGGGGGGAGGHSRANSYHVHDNGSTNGEQLRKLLRLTVNGK